MSLQDIQKGNKIVKKAKRLGRGYGSGKGGKAGRGNKGQQARTGWTIKAQLEGGQTSFLMKIPKLKGFRAINKVVMTPINLDDLSERFDDGATVGMKELTLAGLVSNAKAKVKLLGRGTLDKKLTLSVHAASKAAQAAVEAKGGSVTIL